jgi:hypothetical protein
VSYYPAIHAVKSAASRTPLCGTRGKSTPVLGGDRSVTCRRCRKLRDPHDDTAIDRAEYRQGER